MSIVIWFIIIFIVLILASSIALSFHFTRRSQLGEMHTPDEYGLKYEPIEFKARDGITLRGVWIPAENSDKVVIFLHGHDSSHDFDIYKAVALHDIGLNVQLFDFRAHGRSDGKMMTFGYKERWDVLAAIEFAHNKGMKHFGLHGTSYGGLTAMLTAPICPDVKAVVSDGGPARLMTGAGAWAAERGLPHWPMKMAAWLFLNITSIRLGANLFKYEPIRWVRKISPRPILFIHGDLDQFCADFDELYAAAQEPKEVWRLPEAGHTTASQLYPEEYSRRVNDFFTRYL
jgi:dipeptidyl aminopeptidase/acylaminoacyl peptidase